MTEHRMADDPLGVAFDVMVPCPECDDDEPHDHEANDCGDGCDVCQVCGDMGLIPNPAITRECGTCGGSGEEPRPWRGAYTPRPCSTCEGLGYTFRKTVRVAERVRRGIYLVVPPDDGRVLYRPDPHTSVDITHLWPEHRQGDFRCLLCGEPWPCSSASEGTIRTFPKPGELWEIGYREAELVPVVDLDDDPDVAPRCDFIECTGSVVWMHTFMGLSDISGGFPCWSVADASEHFPTPPKPGQRAGVLGDLVLADKAVRCD